MAYWIAVASREYVTKAVDGVFIQVNHAKKAPLRRIQQGDHVIFYSPKVAMKTGAAVQAFTAIGDVVDETPRQVRQSDTFQPFRRHVRYHHSRDAAKG